MRAPGINEVAFYLLTVVLSFLLQFKFKLQPFNLKLYANSIPTKSLVCKRYCLFLIFLQFQDKKTIFKNLSKTYIYLTFTIKFIVNFLNPLSPPI